jgi:Ala-tRNA(Pro) deacylase
MAIMVPRTIQSYLDERGIRFSAAAHQPCATALETAASTHISGRRFAKTVVLKRDGQYLLAVVPAAERVDLARFRSALGASLDVAPEQELDRLFPECETGAMPPLGGLFGLPVVADACLARQESIAVNGGTHSDVIELRWADYARAEHPQLIEHVTPPAS